jgi:chromate transport protein ChrA
MSRKKPNHLRDLTLTDNEPVTFVLLTDLRLSTQQPRRYFDEAAIQDLVASVRYHGILQPLLVRPLPEAGYEIVNGERRYQAAQKAGLTEVPVIIRQMIDEEALQYVLIEDLRRGDLNLVQETETFLQLLSVCLGKPIADIPPFLYRKYYDAIIQMNHKVVIHDSEIETIKWVFDHVGKMSWQTFTRKRLPLLSLPRDKQPSESLQQEASVTEISLWQLVSLFARIGIMAFGGGVPIHISDNFLRNGWLTEKEYLEAFNWCQCLPGPNGTNLSTFLGWRFKGAWGALLCPIAVLLPGTVILLLASGTLARVQQQQVVQGVLYSVAAAAVGLLLGTTWKLGRSALKEHVQLLNAAITFVLVGIFRVPVYLVIVFMVLVVFYLDKKEIKTENEQAT